VITKHLKESLYTTLRNSRNTVYDYLRVPKKPSFPYLTYQFKNSIESLKDCIQSVDILLEIDFFDYKLNKDTTELDELFDAVDNEINRKDVFVEAQIYANFITSDTDDFITSDSKRFRTLDLVNKFSYRLIRQNKLWQLPTIDEHTFRRQLVYTLKFNKNN